LLQVKHHQHFRFDKLRYNNEYGRTILDGLRKEPKV
jgi:hypothetical protein